MIKHKWHVIYLNGAITLLYLNDKTVIINRYSNNLITMINSKLMQRSENSLCTIHSYVKEQCVLNC